MTKIKNTSADYWMIPTFWPTCGSILLLFWENEKNIDDFNFVFLEICYV